MTRLLHASGDIALAKRTLRLYIQVVGKAWHANNETVGENTDTNQCWVETLVSGARMLCKSASSKLGLEGIEDVREAGSCIEKARTRLGVDANDDEGRRLRASVDLAEGIWGSVLALKGWYLVLHTSILNPHLFHTEQESDTRSPRLAAAHALLLRSINTYPTPSAYFHLALSLVRPGPLQNLKLGIEYAALALEGDPKEVRYWHLLGLLLAATEQWKAASEILERGAELWERDAKETVDGVENEGTFGHDREDSAHDAKHSIETLEANNGRPRLPSSVSMNTVEKADGVPDEGIANGNSKIGRAHV